MVYKPAYSESFFFHKAYIVACDSTENKMKWKKKIYSTFLNPFVEHDVQFIMIKKVQYENGILVIENENDIKYFINLETLDIKKWRTEQFTARERKKPRPVSNALAA